MFDKFTCKWGLKSGVIPSIKDWKNGLKREHSSKLRPRGGGLKLSGVNSLNKGL